MNGEWIQFVFQNFMLWERRHESQVPSGFGFSPWGGVQFLVGAHQRRVPAGSDRLTHGRADAEWLRGRFGSLGHPTEPRVGGSAQRLVSWYPLSWWFARETKREAQLFLVGTPFFGVFQGPVGPSDFGLDAPLSWWFQRETKREMQPWCFFKGKPVGPGDFFDLPLLWPCLKGLGTLPVFGIEGEKGKPLAWGPRGSKTGFGCSRFFVNGVPSMLPQN